MSPARPPSASRARASATRHCGPLLLSRQQYRRYCNQLLNRAQYRRHGTRLRRSRAGIRGEADQDHR